MANQQRFENNVSLLITEFLNREDNQISVANTDGLQELFDGDYYVATIVPAGGLGSLEIVRILAVAGNTLTVLRGQEGTSPQNFLFGSMIELRITAGTLEDLANGETSGGFRVSVAAFGVQSGTVDNTAAFQAAANSGQNLWIPPGEYRTGQVVWPTNTNIVGSGSKTVIRPIDGFATGAFWVSAGGANNVMMGQMDFDAPYATFPNCIPLYLQNGSNNHLYDITVRNSGTMGLFMVDNTDALISNVRVLNGFQHCLQSSGANSARNRFENCYSGPTQLSHGISVFGGIDHRVDNCVSTGAIGFGISFVDVVGGGADNCRSGNSELEGMQITDSSYVTFSNNHLIWENQEISTDLGISIAAQTVGKSCIGNKLIGNFISGNAASGIALASTTIPNTGTGTGMPLTDTVVTGNTLINNNRANHGSPTNGHGSGILLYGSGCQNNLIANNMILDANGYMYYGVGEQNVDGAFGTPTLNRIINNTIIGAVTTPVLKSGSTDEALSSGLLPYTPTISAATGTITSANVVNAYYYEVERIIHFFVQIQIITNGTGAGAVRFTLPRSAQIGAGNGMDIALTGKPLSVRTSGTVGEIRFCDGTYPGANGATLEVSGTYFR